MSTPQTTRQLAPLISSVVAPALLGVAAIALLALGSDVVGRLTTPAAAPPLAISAPARHASPADYGARPEPPVAPQKPLPASSWTLVRVGGPLPVDGDPDSDPDSDAVRERSDSPAR